MKKTSKIRFLFTMCILTTFISSLSEVLFPVFTKEVIDFAVAGNVYGAVSAGIKVIAVCITFSTVGYAPFYFQTKYINELKTQMRVGISNKILKTPLNELSAKRKAELISVYNNDINTVSEQYYTRTLDIIQHSFTIIFSTLALFTLNFTIAFWIVFVNVIKLCATFFFKKPMEKANKATVETNRSLTAKLSDFLNGIHTIRTYKLGSIFKKEIISKNNSKNKADLDYEVITIYAGIIGTLLTHTVNCIILFYGGYLIIKGQYTAGALLSTMQISDVLAYPTMQISYFINYRNGAKPLKKELDSLMCEAEPENNEKVFEKVPAIKLENVDFTAGEHHILKNISVEFEPNKKYLIVGESGCGKSTLLKLIIGIEQDYTGEIYFGGQSQKKLGDKIYNFMRIVFQESYLFQKSIMDNISENLENKSLLNRLIDDLKLNKVIEKYKDTVMDEQSAQTLSGGEKQRIAIARALYAKPQILLLDEVTSSLDKETSKDVEEMLLNYDGTVIAVSHVPNKEIIGMYDKIITMDAGKIISITDSKNYCMK